MLCPIETPDRYTIVGSVESGLIEFLKWVSWKRNSFNLSELICQVCPPRMEWYVFVIVPSALGRMTGLAPYLSEFLCMPYSTCRNCLALISALAFAVRRLSL